MIRFSFLSAALLLLMAIPRLIDREDIPPPWRARLAFLALVGMAATASVLLAAMLFPEVLVSGVREVWASCATAVRTILTRPVARAPSVLAGLALALLLGRFGWSLARDLKASRRARVRWGEPRWRLRGGGPVYVLPLAEPEAYSVGTVRGHVVVSAGCWRSSTRMSAGPSCFARRRTYDEGITRGLPRGGHRPDRSADGGSGHRRSNPGCRPASRPAGRDGRLLSRATMAVPCPWCRSTGSMRARIRPGVAVDCAPGRW